MRTEPWLGLMNTPASRYSRSDLVGVPWAADNGTVRIGPDGPYTDPEWDADDWFGWLAAQDRDALFAVVPDVVGDWLGTQRRWGEYARAVRQLGFRTAYVLQDGAPDFPFEADAVFVGGSDAFKLSDDARRLVAKANALGKWTHLGRVNTLRRLRIATSPEWACDSVDGTFLAFGPDANLPRLRRYMRLAAEPSLWEVPA